MLCAEIPLVPDIQRLRPGALILEGPAQRATWRRALFTKAIGREWFSTRRRHHANANNAIALSNIPTACNSRWHSDLAITSLYGRLLTRIQERTNSGTGNNSPNGARFTHHQRAIAVMIRVGLIAPQNSYPDG
jgi:hypothetical protein